MRKVLLLVLLSMAISLGAKAENKSVVASPVQQPTCEQLENVQVLYHAKSKTSERVEFKLQNTNKRKVTVHCWLVYQGERASNKEKFVVEPGKATDWLTMYHWAGKKAEFNTNYLTVETYVEYCPD